MQAKAKVLAYLKFVTGLVVKNNSMGLYAWCSVHNHELQQYILLKLVLYAVNLSFVVTGISVIRSTGTW